MFFDKFRHFLVWSVSAQWPVPIFTIGIFDHKSVDTHSLLKLLLYSPSMRFDISRFHQLASEQGSARMLKRMHFNRIRTAATAVVVVAPKWGVTSWGSLSIVFLLVVAFVYGWADKGEARFFSALPNVVRVTTLWHSDVALD